MSEAARAPRILHVDGGDGGRLRERLIAAFTGMEHAVVPGGPAFPPLTGKPLPGRLKRLAAAMAGHDLICTYGCGAIDAAMAHTLFADVYHLAPLIHYESHARDEKRTRIFYRRIALGRSTALVLPTRSLERIALELWQQPRSRIRLIPDGIDLRPFNKAPKRDALPGLVKRRDELWVGALAASPDLPAVIGAFAALPEPWQLVVLGEGRDREGIFALAEKHGVEDRVHPLNAVNFSAAAGLFDIFASGQCVVEAMAAGLPLAVSRGGDIGATVASENGPFLAKPGDERGLAEALQKLASDPALRKLTGEANRARARAEYDEATMIERYRALYRGAITRG